MDSSWPISVGANLYRGYDLQTVCQSLSKLGVRYVDLDFIKPPSAFRGSGYGAHVTEDDLGKANQFRKMIEDYGLDTITFSGHMFLITQEEVELFQRKMEFAKAIGVQYISTNEGPKKEEERFYQNLEVIKKKAEELNMVVCLETEMPGDIIQNGEDAQTVFSRVKSSYLGLTYDFGNVYYGHQGQIDLVEDFQKTLDFLKTLLDDQGLKVSCINLNTHSHPKWQLGALTHRDPKLRREAIDAAKKVIDLTDLFQCNSVGLWLGVDGFDYPFQVDYGIEWDLLLESLGEIADYGQQVKIALEYKLKEPRQYLLVGNAFRALYLIRVLNRKNLGVTVDFGHALMAKENPGEVVSVLSREKVLYNVHFNDAYREWDDDLIAGSTNLYETLEFLYYIEKSGYQGYLGFDIFPYRIHPVRALQLCARNTLDLYRLLKGLERDALHKAQEKMDAAQAHELARKVFFK